MPSNEKVRNRKDHYIPQGYLRGFIAPSNIHAERPLWYLDIPKQRWSDVSTARIGWQRGFYDYSEEAGIEAGITNGDIAFTDLERDFPPVREKLIRAGFSNWTDHLELFLRFLHMMKVRSLLYFEQRETEEHKNKIISDMRWEIEHGFGWLKEFDWALRLCDSPDDPFVITETPVVMVAFGDDPAKAIKQAGTVLHFPLCWQACLVGNRRPFKVKTEHFDSHSLHTFRRICRENAQKFIVSPTKLDHLREGKKRTPATP